MGLFDFFRSSEDLESTTNVVIDNKFSVDVPTFLKEDINEEGLVTYNNRSLDVSLTIIRNSKEDLIELTSLMKDDIDDTLLDKVAAYYLHKIHPNLSKIEIDDNIQTTIDDKDAVIINIFDKGGVFSEDLYTTMCLIEGEDDIFSFFSHVSAKSIKKVDDILNQAILSFKEL
jgi:hypothetical protein